MVYSQNSLCCSADCQGTNGESFRTSLNVSGYTSECRGNWQLRSRADGRRFTCTLKEKIEPCNIVNQNYEIIGEIFSQGILQCQQDPCSLADLFYNIQRFIRFIVWFAFWFAVIISVSGAFLWMFGGPFPNLQSQAKSMIRNSIIGYIILLFMGVIFDIVLEFLGPRFKW